jgi:hypothetical protein
MPYNIWNKWDKLKTVMLGECYDPSFFRDIKNSNIRSALQRIASETQNDLEGFQNVLKDFGCDVIRPKLDYADSIMNYTDNNGTLTSIPRSPLQPRDCQLVIGNTLYYTHHDHYSIRDCLNSYNSSNIYNTPSELTQYDYENLKGNTAPDWPNYNEYVKQLYAGEEFSTIQSIHEEITQLTKKYSTPKFPICAPSITVVGTDIYIDQKLDNNLGITNVQHQHFMQDFTKRFSNFRINELRIGGHTDGVFHTLKPGAILSLHDIQRYSDTFPGWDVCYLPDQSWGKVEKFTKLKKQNQGKWWVPGEEDNAEFTHFVETWLQDWVGYVEETVFDVNVLVLDEHHVCVSQQDNEQVNAFLKKHKMEPVYVPWRHRYFWDGGLHCITLDLVREGTQQDYFPQRTAPITDTGF